MALVSSSLIALAVTLFMLLRLRRDGLVWLFALLPFGMMAAVNLPSLGGASILAADIAFAAAALALIVQPGGLAHFWRLIGRGAPGVLLLLFLLWATLGTLFLPVIFAGQTEVYSIGRVAGQRGIVISPLAPNNGNLSQLLRMYLSAAAFFAAGILVLMRPAPALVLKAVTAATVLHLAMGAIDLVTQTLHATGLLGWARTANYALTLGQRMAGLNRMIGAFPEASSYGYTLLGLFGFWLAYWARGGGTSRLPAVMAALTGLFLLRSTSSSTYVGMALLLGLFLLARLPRALSGRVVPRAAVIAGLGVALVPGLAMAAVVLTETSPAVSAYLDRALFTKLDSDSGVERMAWNAQALRNFADTWMIGTGLGAVRASNWLVAALATTGLPGTLMLAGLLLRLFRLRVSPEARPEAGHILAALQWGMAGFLCRALVVKATPNLDLAFFAMAGLAAGLSVSTWRQAAELRALRPTPRRGLAAHA